MLQMCSVACWTWQTGVSTPVSICSSSSSSSNEYYLGCIIALLLQDHRTLSTKSVCSSQYVVTDQHWATGAQIKHSPLSQVSKYFGRQLSSRPSHWQHQMNDAPINHCDNIMKWSTDGERQNNVCRQWLTAKWRTDSHREWEIHRPAVVVRAVVVHAMTPSLAPTHCPSH